MSSIYFSSQRSTGGQREKSRLTNGLPTYSSAVQEKLNNRQHARTSSWFVPVSVAIPGVQTRKLRMLIPNPARLHKGSVTRFGRKRGTTLLCVGLIVITFIIFAFHQRFGSQEKQWPTISLPGDPPTLIFRKEDLQRIWKWEIESGHYPSSRKIPETIGFTSAVPNPALPPRKASRVPPRLRSMSGSVTTTHGLGPQRVYLDMQPSQPNIAYAPRPVPGSIADLDVVMNNCDFSEGQYVRDCLEVLRLGAGLEKGARVRRGEMNDWKYVYVENEVDKNYTEPAPSFKAYPAFHSEGEVDPNVGLTKKRGADWEKDFVLPPTLQYKMHSELPDACDEEHPRLYHMFWTGPFTDKPYAALLSFLYTQNLGLHLEQPDPAVCRPKFWLWINPGPAAGVPNPNALRDMFDQLKSNAWASPFLHPRFKDVIQFKLWNTTEQLDSIPELKDEWRAMQDSLFNSGGHIINVPGKVSEVVVTSSSSSSESEDSAGGTVGEAASATHEGKDDDDMLNRLGSKSSASYDRLSVILSDMARFVLCHRFGGIYLDADTIFLRDWEELWGWKGAFAYRWSRLEKYNTAVLRLNKGSALGSFLFRTALKNGLDFHPMTVSRYTKDASLEGLLLRLPDALFDSAWLNTEFYQRDRPPQPYLQEFGDFFMTPLQNSAAPQAIGFDGFFKGAFSYHFHNFWWQPFDSQRNWPDLGVRFAAGERIARQQAGAIEDDGTWIDKVSDDKRDLDWATVLKRTFESYLRGERPNLYGEYIQW